MSELQQDPLLERRLRKESLAIKNIKKDILLTLAETFSFDSVKRKYPKVSDDFIKELLIEASLCYKNEPAAKAAPVIAGMDTDSLIVFVDGASKGNPGLSGAGVAIKDKKGNNVALVKKYLGIMTNNQAEYSALIIALEEALNLKCAAVKIFMDSELVVKQIKGEYRVKNSDLKILSNNVRELLKKFDKYDITHITRDNNRLADSLANDAIKEKKPS